MRSIVSFSLLLLALLFGAPRSLACSCFMPPVDTEEKLRKHVGFSLAEDGAIFSGEVVAKDALGVKFKVKRVWKGDVKDDVTLTTGARLTGGGHYAVSTCVYRFELGKRYLVFASPSEDGLTASTCSWTRPLVDADRFVRELDRRRKEKGKK